MPQVLPPDVFLQQSELILDVRSPGEYTHAHIPGAVSFPLFTDAERAEIGICYKQQGQEPAVELGLKIIGPKLVDFVIQAKSLAPNRQVRIHCWRGGMRSGSMGLLLETAGFQVKLLEGGYKAFRRWVRSTLAIPKTIVILGGMTGTGKTEILTALSSLGEQVLDLEALASNRGSSYGSLGLPPQPSNEQFENLVAFQWHGFNLTRPIWIEAESQRIGCCRIPNELFEQMEKAVVIEITRPQSERIAILKSIYGAEPAEQLIAATQRIQKRLGGLRTQQAIAHFCQGDWETAIALVLEYYDKTYQYDLRRRPVPLYTIDVSGCSARDAALRLVAELQTVLPQPSVSLSC